MLEWDQERFLPWVNDGQIRYEHLHRYNFAKQFVDGKDVLDLGCGEGYGTYSISQTANSIIGLDIDSKTIEHAQKKYINRNLEFHIGSVAELPKFDKKFDVIICFEVIEHLTEHLEFIKSIKNLLKPSGILLISTPNTKTYSDEKQSKNPHHVKELSFSDFENLLKNNFNYHKTIHQRVYAGSFMYQNLELSSDFQFLKKNNEYDIISDDNDLEPVYFIGVCSDSEVNEFKINNLLDLDDQILQYVYNEVRGPKFTKQIDEIINKYQKKYDFDINQCNILISSLQNSNIDQKNSINDLLKELNKIRSSKIMKILRIIDKLKRHS